MPGQRQAERLCGDRRHRPDSASPLSVITVAAGNTWFVLNRYGVHQFFDWFLYNLKVKGPARGKEWWKYLDDLGTYTRQSLHTPDSSKRARQHVAFRASAALLSLTFAEILLALIWVHSGNSPVKGHWRVLLCLSAVAFGTGIWQTVITRRIDYFVVTGAGTHAKGRTSEAPVSR
jgi:hypothetical protein